MNHLHLLNASGRLASALAGEIERIATAALTEVADDLDLSGIDLVICEYPGLAIEELGVGGYSPSGGLVFVAVEPASLRLAELADWCGALEATVAHELHHAKRWQGPGYGTRLIDSLVSEGLATVYEMERYGIVPLYAVSDADLGSLWGQVRPILDEGGHHARWFFGGEGVPRWTGYALGVELARSVLSRKEMSAREAVWMPSDEFTRP